MRRDALAPVDLLIVPAAQSPKTGNTFGTGNVRDKIQSPHFVAYKETPTCFRAHGPRVTPLWTHAGHGLQEKETRTRPTHHARDSCSPTKWPYSLIPVPKVFSSWSFQHTVPRAACKIKRRPGRGGDDLYGNSRRRRFSNPGGDFRSRFPP